MSWLDRINNVELQIFTGDGSLFTPLYKNARRSKDMNVRKYKFNNIVGNLVLRGEAESGVYPFEFHFTGDDHLDEADRFFLASNNRSPWTMIHPEYGEILCQPSNLAQGNQNDNVSVFTGELWETISDIYPDTDVDVRSEVLKSLELANETAASNYGQKLGTIQPSTTSTATEKIEDAEIIISSSAVTDFDLQSIQNSAALALSAINGLSSDPVAFMRLSASLARTPARFYSNVTNRINTIALAYEDLKLAIIGLPSLQNKLYFEAFGGAYVTAMCEASVLTAADIADLQQIEGNTIKDYRSRGEVLTVIDILNATFLDFLETLSSLQSEVDATPDSFTPSQTTIQGVKETINKTAGQLQQIAVNAKQERFYTLDENLSITVLAHRLLGTVDNEEVQDFIEANGFVFDEMILVKKGRTVTYFV